MTDFTPRRPVGSPFFKRDGSVAASTATYTYEVRFYSYGSFLPKAVRWQSNTSDGSFTRVFRIRLDHNGRPADGARDTILYSGRYRTLLRRIDVSTGDATTEWDVDDSAETGASAAASLAVNIIPSTATAPDLLVGVINRLGGSTHVLPSPTTVRENSIVECIAATARVTIRELSLTGTVKSVLWRSGDKVRFIRTAARAWEVLDFNSDMQINAPLIYDSRDFTAYSVDDARAANRAEVTVVDQVGYATFTNGEADILPIGYGRMTLHPGVRYLVRITQRGLADNQDSGSKAFLFRFQGQASGDTLPPAVAIERCDCTVGSNPLQINISFSLPEPSTAPLVGSFEIVVQDATSGNYAGNVGVSLVQIGCIGQEPDIT